HLNAQAYSTLGSILAGAGLVLLDSFSASRFWEQASDYEATEVNAVGAMVEMLMRRDPNEVERGHKVRLVYTAPALARERHLEVEERFDTRLIYGYGLSECPYGAVWPRDETPYGSMGLLRQHPELGEINEARIVDDSGAPVSTGSVGELLLRNPAVMKGYYEMPDETRKALGGGWLHTGDLVRADDDGYMFFVSRKKHIIRRRGENLSPSEVENALESHPRVEEAAVVGVPSDLSEEEVKAFVVSTQGEVSAGELQTWCRDRLAAYKVPRYIEFVAELPHTATNRVAKHRLPSGLTGNEDDGGVDERTTSG
ncbi:MAG: AMP-binding protein, partial [Acidimicrobiia bacterium]|nr:AMP-binding protein [Acidimicrobiia bacterium]